jgi:mediator of RNA polymerase II transcription subunit 5
MNNLIDHAFAVTVDPMISNETTPRLRMEAQDSGTDLEVPSVSNIAILVIDNESEQSYLESKLTAETSLDDAKVLLERICRDPGCHAAFAEVVHKVCQSNYDSAYPMRFILTIYSVLLA